MFSPGLQVFQIGITLDASMTLSKSGCLRWFKGAQGALRGSKINLGGTNVLPGPRGFQIGATLDALLSFLKSGGFRGTLRRFKEVQGNGRRPKLVLVCIYHLLGSQGFRKCRIHGECMNKTKLSFIPLFLMHGSLYHDISEIQRAKYTNTQIPNTRFFAFI